MSSKQSTYGYKRKQCSQSSFLFAIVLSYLCPFFYFISPLVSYLKIGSEFDKRRLLTILCFVDFVDYFIYKSRLISLSVQRYPVRTAQSSTFVQVHRYTQLSLSFCLIHTLCDVHCTGHCLFFLVIYLDHFQ